MFVFTHSCCLFVVVVVLQVVSSHAVSVPPTRGLNGDMKGYLPVHCIHQLIKMKNFRKYNISIKVSGRVCEQVVLGGVKLCLLPGSSRRTCEGDTLTVRFERPELSDRSL